MVKDILFMILGFILFSCGLFSFGLAFSEIEKSHYQNAFMFVIYFIVGVSIGSIILLSIVLI